MTVGIPPFFVDSTKFFGDIFKFFPTVNHLTSIAKVYEELHLASFHKYDKYTPFSFGAEKNLQFSLVQSHRHLSPLLFHTIHRLMA